MPWKAHQFPTEEHPDWNPDDPYADPVALLEHRELEVRKKFIRMEKAKILREKMKLCYLREGVNQLVNCREIVDMYWESIQDVDFQLADSTRFASGHQNQAKK
ncbi:hypothetical protein WJX81_001642 [Elliptochloris bilobata]|uniref:Uncharacterized protein n=1 Tax=Elliptochloris bilobata TaxID=381761 RepID=A0AAW1SEH5_9CHLO